MKHLIETADSSSLTRVDYDRVILDSSTDNVIVRGGFSNEHPYVDLGLSVKWATMNVGATSETDYGYFFQWGDIVDKTNSDCSWKTYKYGNGAYDKLTKYCTDSSRGTLDDKTTLELKDDAARAIMGGDWRMPTSAEFQELIDNTTSEWTQVGDVYGRRFTSKKEGYQNNSIFIPASGTLSAFSAYVQEAFYCVWSSSLDTSYPLDALTLNFTSSRVSADSSLNRCEGVVVRGVL